jgi:hypothetical protein
MTRGASVRAVLRGGLCSVILAFRRVASRLPRSGLSLASFQILAQFGGKTLLALFSRRLLS